MANRRSRSAATSDSFAPRISGRATIITSHPSRTRPTNPRQASFISRRARFRTTALPMLRGQANPARILDPSETTYSTTRLPVVRRPRASTCLISGLRLSISKQGPTAAASGGMTSVAVPWTACVRPTALRDPCSVAGPGSSGRRACASGHGNRGSSSACDCSAERCASCVLGSRGEPPSRPSTRSLGARAEYTGRVDTKRSPRPPSSPWQVPRCRRYNPPRFNASPHPFPMGGPLFPHLWKVPVDK